MPITVEWFNKERTAIIQRFEGSVTVDEMYKTMDTAHEMITGAKHTIHVINDLTASAGIPTAIVRIGRYAERQVAPNQGISIAVGMGTFVEIAVSTLQKLFPKALGDMHLAHTLNDAIKIIKEHEDSSKGARV